MSVDPLAGKLADISPFGYAHNNPINRLDADGRIDWPVSGLSAVNKKDYSDGAWSLQNVVVRTSTYMDTDRPPGATNPHIGIDYRADEGTPFYSLGEGVVRDVGAITSGGAKGAKYVTVEYQNGDKLRFLHISELAGGIRVGNLVLEGEKLGETGKSGTNVAHLHVDAKDKNGERINPETNKYGTITNKEFFSRFNGDATRLKEVKDLEIRKQANGGGPGSIPPDM